jgi:TP901 family phage tail tape measure protein
VDTLADYSITGDTKLDTSGFTKGVSSMTVAAGNLIADLTKTAGSKLAGLAQSSVSVGMSFDASMSQVAATMGTTVDQIDSLTKVAKEMGSTTKFTATQAADALNYLALAGYDADKAAEVLPSVLNLAAAGGMDLAYASDLVTDAMASLNIEANKQNVDEFGNKLAMAASKANANVAQLGEAILTVGGTAANLKEGTTELTTALGLLANVGLKGAEGGTHLRNIILSLQSPTKDASKVMQELGLEVYDAQGNMRGLDDILTDLNDAMSGMTQGGKDSVINALFNKTDLAAVNGLLAAQGEQWETLADQIDAAGEATGDGLGAMEQMAETQIDNLQGAVTIMSSAFEGLQLAIYDELEPTLTDVVKWGTDCLTQLTTALSEGGPEAMLAAAGEILSDLAAGIAAQLPGLMQSGVDIITQLTQSLSDAMPAMLDTGAQVLGALVQGLSDSIPQLLSSAVQIISDFALYLADNADAIYDGGLQLVESLVVGITDNLPQLITAAAVLIARFVAAFISHLPKILECAGAMLTTLVDGIVRGAENLAEAALACVAELLGVWDGSMDDWGSIGVNIVKGIQDGILSWWDNLVSSVQEKVNGMISTVKSLLGIHSPSKVFSEIGVNVCAGLAQGLTKGDRQVKNAAKTVVASVTDSTTELEGQVTRTVETVTQQMASGAMQQKQTMETVRETAKTVTSTFDTLVDGVKTTTQTVTETLTDGTETQKKVITETYDDVVDGALVTVERVKTIAADGTEQVAEQVKKSAADTLDGLWKELQEKANEGVLGTFDDLYSAVKNQDWLGVGEWVAKTIYGGLTADQKKQIEDYALGLVGKINGVLGQYQQQIAAKAWDIGTQICSGLTNGFADVWQQASQLGSTLTSIFTGLKGPLSNAATAISKGLQGGLLSSFPSIYAGVAGMIGSIGAAFEGMMTAISAALNATVFGIPMGVIVAGAAVALGIAIAAIVSKLGGSKKSSGVSGGGSVSGGSGGSGGISGDIDISTGTGSLEDAINANTKALTKTNAALADMIRQAGSLVLSDNMRLGSTVAASGTAQVRAAASSYHREGDTTINQYIQSKAQSAADLARETRWEADKTRRQRRG